MVVAPLDTLKQPDKQPRECDSGQSRPTSLRRPRLHGRTDRWVQGPLSGWLCCLQGTISTNRQGWLDPAHPRRHMGIPASQPEPRPLWASLATPTPRHPADLPPPTPCPAQRK